ncbi:unnamed protein product [Sphagnum tenellum]
MLDHTRRGPDPRLGEEELHARMHASVAGCGSSAGWDVCGHGNGKSMFRPEHVMLAGVHSPKKWNGSVIAIFEDREMSWCNHYYIRSREDAYLKSRQWSKEDPVRMYQETDVKFWSKVEGRAAEGQVAARAGREDGQPDHCQWRVRLVKQCFPIGIFKK